MRRHSIKMGAVVVALMALIPATAACSPSSGGAQAVTKSSESAKLVVWGWTAPADEINAKIFSVYEKSHPGVTVEYRTYLADTYEQTLALGLAGSKGPDVVQLQAYGILQKHVEAGTLLPLDDSNVPTLSSFGKLVLDGARGAKDGKVYGVPFAIQTAHIFYNKAIFEKFGLSVPTTWDQFITICQKLKDAKVTPLAWNFKDTWETPLYQEIFGASIYGAGGFQDRFMAGGTKLTDPAYVASINVLNDLKPYLPSGFSALGYSDATTLFASGKAAMIPDGIWNVTAFKKTSPDMKIGLFPAPPGPNAAMDKPVTTTYVDGSFGVSKKSLNRAQALKLVNWMTTKEFGQLYSDVLGQLSAVPGVVAKDPLLQEAQKLADDSPSPYLCYSKLNNGSPACDQLMSENIQKMLLGSMTATQVAQNVQRGLDQWFKPTN